MPDPGKGARVLGYFVFQLGAGIMLDTRADVWGGLVAVCGAGLFLWGMLQIAAAKTQPIGQDSSGGAAPC